MDDDSDDGDRIVLDVEECPNASWAVIFRVGHWGDAGPVSGVGFLVELYRRDGRGFTFFAPALRGRGDVAFWSAAEIFERLAGRATTCSLQPEGRAAAPRAQVPHAPLLRLVGPEAGGPGGVA